MSREVTLIGGCMNDLADVAIGDCPVHRDYEITGYYLRPIGEPSRAYDPLQFPELATDFAHLGNGSSDDLLAFARQWGLLGSYDGDSVPWLGQGDSVPWLRGHAAQVKLVLDLLNGLQNGDQDVLRHLLEGPVDDHGLRHLPFLVGGDVKAAPGGFGFYPEIRSPDSNAASVVEEVISANIGDLHGGLHHLAGRAEFALHQWFDLPIQTVYWHLAQLAVEGGNLRKCEWCKRYFVRKHGNQRFCPPKPDYEESQCAAAARSKSWRDRKGVSSAR